MMNLKLYYPDDVRDHELEDFNRAFDLWYDIWVETRKEVDTNLATPSDNFHRQNEILVLSMGKNPIGMICHRYVDIRHSSVRKDSFFHRGIWPEDVVSRLPQLGNRFVLGSHVFIHPDFRKNASGLPTKNLLCALSFDHLNYSKPDVVLGMMRKDKGMHDVFYKSGAVTLHADTNWYQIPVDLIAFFPVKKPILVDPQFKDTIEQVSRGCERFRKNFYERQFVREMENESERQNRRAG